jgi:hypothetical protein
LDDVEKEKGGGYVVEEKYRKEILKVNFVIEARVPHHPSK